MFDTRGYVHRVKTAAQQPSSAAARSPRYTFFTRSRFYMLAPEPTPAARSLWRRCYFWWSSCGRFAVWWMMKVYLQNHQAYTICSSVLWKVFHKHSGHCHLTIVLLAQVGSRQKLSKREWFVRIALHYIFLIRDGWDSTLNQSVLQQTLDSRWIYICVFFLRRLLTNISWKTPKKGPPILRRYFNPSVLPAKNSTET